MSGEFDISRRGRAYVLVEGKPRQGPQRKIAVRPDSGHIEYVPSVLLRLVRGHDLREHCPGRIVSPLDGVPHVNAMKIRRVTGQLLGFIHRHALDSEIGLEVYLYVDERAVLQAIVRLDNTLSNVELGQTCFVNL